jgi:hypothetical protein
MIDFSPSFAVWGGRLLLTRGNKGAFSERDRILPLFCSVGGGNDQNTTININRVLFLSLFCFTFSGVIFSTSTHSLTAAIWTLIRQQLPATTLKMRLWSLLLSAYTLLVMTMTFK